MLLVLACPNTRYLAGLVFMPVQTSMVQTCMARSFLELNTDLAS